MEEGTTKSDFENQNKNQIEIIVDSQDVVRKLQLLPSCPPDGDGPGVCKAGSHGALRLHRAGRAPWTGVGTSMHVSVDVSVGVRGHEWVSMPGHRLVRPGASVRVMAIGAPAGTQRRFHGPRSECAAGRLWVPDCGCGCFPCGMRGV